MNFLKSKISYIVLFAMVFASSCNNDDDGGGDEVFVLPSKIINKIVVDDSGVKWIATEKGIVSLNGTLWAQHSNNTQATDGAIADIATEPQTNTKTIWMASKTGLSYFQKNENPINVSTFNKSSSGILSDTIFSVGIDSKNIKFIGTAKGLSILKDGNWESYFGKKTEEILSEYKISDVATVSNGKVYVSTQGGGVSRFNYADAVSGATTLNLPWASGLVSENVFTVVIVNGIEQWYGTDQGAAHHKSELTKSDWVSYSRADGLVCDTVYAIAQDLTGNVWFGTHRGVSKLSGTSWTNFSTKVGLAGNKVNTVAIDLDGSVWFGTDTGISHLMGNTWKNY